MWSKLCSCHCVANLSSIFPQPTSINTDSDEYRTHNNTESDIEVEKGVVVIKDVEIEIEAVETVSGPQLNLI